MSLKDLSKSEQEVMGAGLLTIPAAALVAMAKGSKGGFKRSVKLGVVGGVLGALTGGSMELFDGKGDCAAERTLNGLASGAAVGAGIGSSLGLAKEAAFPTPTPRRLRARVI